MLQTFKKHSGSIFAKILFALLVASFAFFGIGDMFRSYTAMQPVAKVGSISISQEEFFNAYKKVVTRLQTLAHGKLKPEDIRNLGADKQVLNDLINNAVLNNEIKHLGLIVSDDSLEQFIKSVPAFLNKDGQFDRNQFRYLLHHNEMSEADFVQQSKDILLKRQLVGTLSSGINLPAKYQDLLFKAQEQQRVFNIAYLPLSLAKISDAPKDEDLEQLYQTQQEYFARPEYRDVSVLIVEPKKIQATIKITPEQITEEYNRRQNEFITPELRDVTQLTLVSRENAVKAQAEALLGKSMTEISRNLDGTIRTYSDANPDKFSTDHAKDIFAQDVGGVTEVLSSAYGWTFFKITKVTPPHTRNIDEVTSKIEADLRTQIYNIQINELQNKIEDGLAGGVPMADLAQQHDLSVLNLGLINAGGTNQDGKSVVSSDLKEVVLENAFNQDEGMASQLVNLSDGRSIAVFVAKIVPQNLPPLTDIRAEVVTLWRKNKEREAVAKIAQNMVAHTKSKQDLEDKAKQHNLTVRTLQPISRIELEDGKLRDDKVTPQALHAAFGLSENQATAAPVKDGFVVVMPLKTLPLDTSKLKEKREKFDKALMMMVQRDSQMSYIKALKEQNKPDINYDVINNLLVG